MKKDRNCGMGNYAGMAPNYGGMVMPGVFPMPGAMNYPLSGYENVPNSSTGLNSYGSPDLTNLSNKVNSLEQRINRLENLVNNGTYSNGYNSSNYQMM